jgi:predicted CoA-binding protein
MTNPETLLRESQTYAVLGVNQDPESYANLILRKLREKGKIAHPVNPKYPTLFDEEVYADLNTTPSVPEVVVFVVNPTIGVRYLQTVKDLGVKAIWLQPGTISEKLLEEAFRLKIEVVEACVLVVSNFI